MYYFGSAFGFIVPILFSRFPFSLFGLLLSVFSPRSLGRELPSVRVSRMSCSTWREIQNRSTWQSHCIFYCVLRGRVGVGVMRHAYNLAQILRAQATRSRLSSRFAVAVKRLRCATVLLSREVYQPPGGNTFSVGVKWLLWHTVCYDLLSQGGECQMDAGD